jgi:hypothetical protein
MACCVLAKAWLEELPVSVPARHRLPAWWIRLCLAIQPAALADGSP